jgi:hypothetical protein
VTHDNAVMLLFAAPFTVLLYVAILSSGWWLALSQIMCRGVLNP